MLKILIGVLCLGAVLYVLDGIFSKIGRFATSLPGFMLIFFSIVAIVGYFVIRKISINRFNKNHEKCDKLVDYLGHPISLKNYFESLEEAEDLFDAVYEVRYFLPKPHRKLAKLYKEVLDLQYKSAEEFIRNAINASFQSYKSLIKSTGVKFSDKFEKDVSEFSDRFIGKNKEYADVCLKYLQVYEKIAGTIFEVDGMEGHEFEHWCADLLRKSGFTDVEVTKGSGDQGVDVIAVKDGIHYAIQCKCYSSDLGNKPVQEVHAGKVMYKCQVGVVMTNRHFTAGAKELADATGVLLWDRDKLEEMLGM